MHHSIYVRFHPSSIGEFFASAMHSRSLNVFTRAPSLFSFFGSLLNFSPYSKLMQNSNTENAFWITNWKKQRIKIIEGLKLATDLHSLYQQERAYEREKLICMLVNASCALFGIISFTGRTVNANRKNEDGICMVAWYRPDCVRVDQQATNA